MFGRNSGIRTHDLTHPKGARYLAAPYPVNIYIIKNYTIDPWRLQEKGDLWLRKEKQSILMSVLLVQIVDLMFLQFREADVATIVLFAWCPSMSMKFPVTANVSVKG